MSTRNVKLNRINWGELFFALGKRLYFIFKSLTDFNIHLKNIYVVYMKSGFSTDPSLTTGAPGEPGEPGFSSHSNRNSNIFTSKMFKTDFFTTVLFLCGENPYPNP